MLRLIALVSCLPFLALPAASRAADGFGLGIMVGEPTGLSGKLWLGSRSAVDMGVAWSFEGPDALHLHSDYLAHNFNLIRVDKGALALHYGAGAHLKIDDGDDDVFGLRIPVGLTYHFAGAPMDVFLEVVPVMDIVPDMDFEPGGALGVRYFFGRRASYE